jgi:hypothetical protein
MRNRTGTMRHTLLDRIADCLFPRKQEPIAWFKLSLDARFRGHDK